MHVPQQIRPAFQIQVIFFFNLEIDKIATIFTNALEISAIIST